MIYPADQTVCGAFLIKINFSKAFLLTNECSCDTISIEQMFLTIKIVIRIEKGWDNGYKICENADRC